MGDDTGKDNGSAFTHYDLLGVETTASAHQIKKAYRTLARDVHPDKNKDPKATQEFQKLLAAYQVLSDEKARAKYDDKLEAEKQVHYDSDDSNDASKTETRSYKGRQEPWSSPPSSPCRCRNCTERRERTSSNRRNHERMAEETPTVYLPQGWPYKIFAYGPSLRSRSYHFAYVPPQWAHHPHCAHCANQPAHQGIPDNFFSNSNLGQSHPCRAMDERQRMTEEHRRNVEEHVRMMERHRRAMEYHQGRVEDLRNIMFQGAPPFLQSPRLQQSSMYYRQHFPIPMEYATPPPGYVNQARSNRIWMQRGLG